MKEILHTPEGLRDIYGQEYSHKLTLEDNLHHTLQLYGYRDIQTPTFEYADVFGEDIGTVPAKELYRFFDKEGNMLSLRPDITPSIARATATLFEHEDIPIRLCYKGNTFINHSNYQGRLREVTQLGAEMIGVNDAESDAEMLAMVIEALKTAGLEKFQINVGNAAFFHSLIQSAHMKEKYEKKVRELLDNRNYAGVDKVLQKAFVLGKGRAAFEKLQDLMGDYNVLKQAAEIAPDQDAIDAIDRLEKIYNILKWYGLEKHITFDLSMSSSYEYYTGIIFRGYTYETGDAIVTGGRYDHLLEKFGKNAPSIGFVVVVDELLNAMERQKTGNFPAAGHTILVYDEVRESEAISLAKEFRGKEKRVEIMKRVLRKPFAEYEAYGKRALASNLIYLQEDHQIKAVNLIKNTRKTIKRGTKK